MNAELDLVGVTLIEAWVQGNAALEIDELRQNFDDASRGCERVSGDSEEGGDLEGDEQ